MAHEPTPWLPNDVKITTAEGELIALVYGRDGYSMEENRAFIVKAVNAHADLVTELREILDWAIVERAPLREQELQSIRAALAKAGATP